VLGTRGEVESSGPYHSRHSGVLLDDTVLLDLGEQEFLRYHPRCVFITHLHPDHAFFMRRFSKEPIRFPMPVYVPEQSGKGFDMRLVKETMSCDQYTVWSIPTHHSKKVASAAFLVQRNGQRILYTGDLVWINKEYRHLFDPVDLVVTEASFLRKGGRVIRDQQTGRLYGHAGIPNLIALFKEYTKHLLFVHFGEWFYHDVPLARKKLMDLGKQQGIHVIVGYDGLILDTGDLAR
jgi:ribonuclease BN (tRNA processing enzyme)